MSENERLYRSLKLIVRASALVFFGLVLSKLLSYAYRIIIARNFGAEVYGLFSLATITVGWFATVAGLGLSDGILRYLVIYREKNPEKANQIFKFVWSISLVSCILATILFYFIAEPLGIKFFKNAALVPMLKWFSLSIPLFTFAHIYLSILRAYHKIGWYSFILNVFQNIVKALFLILFVWIGFQTSAIIFSYLLSILGMFVISYLVARKAAPKLFLKSKEKGNVIQIKKEVLNYSVPLLLFNLAYVVFYWIDSVSLGYYKTASIVGFYNAAVPIALLLGMVPELFVQLFLPLITAAYSKKDKFLVEQLSKQVSKWILIFNLPIFSVLFIFPGFILGLFFGPEFIVAENSLRILAIGALLSSVFFVWQQITYARGESKLFLKNIIIASVVNVVLNSILIPLPTIGPLSNSLGVEGASIATLISVIVFNLLFFRSIRQYLPTIPFRRKMINVILAMLVSALLVGYLFSDSGNLNLIGFILRAVVLGTVYLACLFLFRAFDKNDIEILNTTKRKILKR